MNKSQINFMHFKQWSSDSLNAGVHTDSLQMAARLAVLNKKQAIIIITLFA